MQEPLHLKRTCWVQDQSASSFMRKSMRLRPPSSWFYLNSCSQDSFCSKISALVRSPFLFFTRKSNKFIQLHFIFYHVIFSISLCMYWMYCIYFISFLRQLLFHLDSVQLLFLWGAAVIAGPAAGPRWALRGLRGLGASAQPGDALTKSRYHAQNSIYYIYIEVFMKRES